MGLKSCANENHTHAIELAAKNSVWSFEYCFTAFREFNSRNNKQEQFGYKMNWILYYRVQCLTILYICDESF